MKPFFLIARARSGTTAFRDVLSASSNTYALGEVFSNHSHKPLPFVPWYGQRIVQEPALAIPTAENRTRLFREFLTFLEKQRPAQYQSSPTVLTINYNSLHILNTVWQNIYDAPFLCNLITRQRFGVIHMVRRNLLRTLLSEQRAKQTNIWHVKDAHTNNSEPVRVRIDTEGLLHDLTMRAREIEMIAHFFHNYKLCRTIYYEDLFDAAGKPNETEITKVLMFLGASRTGDMTTKFRRTSSTELATNIANWPEVVRCLEGTPFGSMLQS